MARLTRMLCLAATVCALCAAPAGATHVACGQTITQDTTLDSDLIECSSGLTVAADNVTLDLGGHAIDGTGETGNGVESVRETAGTEIRNGTIRQFRYGVLAEEPENQRLSDLLLKDNRTGVDLFMSGGLAEVVDSTITGGRVALNLDGGIHVARNEITDNSFAGILLDYSNGTVEDNTLERNGMGIRLAEAQALIRHNRIVGNEAAGIEYDYWQEGQVIANLIAQNGTGINDGGSTLTITGNVLRANKGHGASVSGGGQITGNRASRNGGSGIIVRGPGILAGRDCAAIASNQAWRNGTNGMEIRGGGDEEACTSVRVLNNHSHHNKEDGILVSDTMRETFLTANRTERNGDDGIDVDGQAGGDGDPAWSPDGTLLAFHSNRGPTSGLYVVGADGDGLRRLADGRQPDWSPDGQSIAFVSPDGIRVIGADGSGERLVAQGLRPQWSPDGREIMFESGAEIRIVEVATGAVRTLIRGRDPEWRPSGDLIAYVGFGVRTIRPDGTGDIWVAPGIDLSWSPDSERIAYTDGYDLSTVAADGTDNQFVLMDEPDDADPEWSPAGDLISYYKGAGPPGTYVVQPDGDGLRFVAADRDGAWSPDGKRIAFAGLRIIDVATGEQVVLSNDVNSFARLSRNRAPANVDLGIEAGAGVQDGGGNRAAGNGDPRQCTGVACTP